MPTPRFYALVPCAGSGERSGAQGPKQYVHIAGKSLVGHTLHVLAQVSRLHQTLVVLHPRDDEFETHAAGFEHCASRVGGATRAASVANGLNELLRRGADASDWVLVHDAARCLLQPEWVNALIDACASDEVGGLLALPLADTLKEESEGRTVRTVPRAGKWQAQTPQMFRIAELQVALAKAGDAVTDEASAIEATGRAPKLVLGSIENFKITYPGDFALAERLLRTR